MMQLYIPLFYVHVALAILSPTLFSLRVARALAGEDPARGWLRIAPHVVDTLLIVAGIGLALILRQYPFVNSWLTAKLTALLVYIVLGHVAVRRARAKSRKIAAWVAALAVLFYIYAVAYTKSPTLGL